MRLNEISKSPYLDIRYSPDIEQYLPQIKESFSKPIELYRGMKRTELMVLADGTKMNRKSANTKNYYTLLIDDILPEWKDYPKRSQSFICSNKETHAGHYGTAYRVVPLENQKMGICSGPDIWYSFDRTLQKYGITSLDHLNRVIGYLYHQTFDELLTDSNSKVFIDEIRSLDKAIQTMNIPDYLNTEGGRVTWELFKKHGILKFLEQVLSPSANGFALTNADNYPNIGQTREVWLSGKVLFIETAFTYEDVLYFINDDKKHGRR